MHGGNSVTPYVFDQQSVNRISGMVTAVSKLAKTPREIYSPRVVSREFEALTVAEDLFAKVLTDDATTFPPNVTCTLFGEEIDVDISAFYEGVPFVNQIVMGKKIGQEWYAFGSGCTNPIGNLGSQPTECGNCPECLTVTLNDDLIYFTGVRLNAGQYVVSQIAPYSYPPYYDCSLWRGGDDSPNLFARFSQRLPDFRNLLNFNVSIGEFTWTAATDSCTGSITVSYVPFVPVSEFISIPLTIEVSPAEGCVGTGQTYGPVTNADYIDTEYVELPDRTGETFAQELWGIEFPAMIRWVRQKRQFYTIARACTTGL